MHVCIDYRPALHEATGVGTYVRGLLRGLGEGYPQDRYVALSASLRHRLDLPPELVAAGVEPLDVRFPVRLLDWLWHRRRWPPVEVWSGPVDIAHSPSPMLLPARRARQLVTVHDCYYLRAPEDVAGPVRRDYVPLTRRAVADADAVLTVSETTRRELMQLLGTPADKVHVTPLAVEPHFRPQPAPGPGERARQGLPDRYLLFVGRREPRKDPATLLKAFAKVRESRPELSLLLVGPPGHRWEEIWEAAPERARQGTVCLPHRTPHELPAVYAGAEALLLPSRWEGFGLTALEAMAVGTPVVAARAGALPEVLGDAPLWIEPGDAEGLAAACLRLLEDPEARRACGDAGRARAATYSWSRTAERTHAVYQRVAGT